MLEQKIIDLLNRGEEIPLSEENIHQRLRLRSGQEKDLRDALVKLENQGIVATIKGGLLAMARDANLVSGRIRMNRRGGGVVFPELVSADPIQIEPGDAGTAFHEDRVLVRVQNSRNKESRQTGKVIRVLERARTHLVGTLWKSRRIYYVVPDHFRFPYDIYVTFSSKLTRKPRKGSKVVVRLEEWETHRHNPEGVVEEVLGSGHSFDTETQAILKQFNLRSTFPRRVELESRAFKAPGNEDSSPDRVDCRQQDVITIDPVNARDFDDAFFIKPKPKGGWKLWVHIADVSNYVLPGTALDREARKRGNSTYLMDRVIPMLPERLSNDLCSLKPGVDRYAKCIEVDLNTAGDIIKSRLYSSLIHSRKRYAYEEVQQIIERKPQHRFESLIHQARELAALLRKRRFRSGSLDLSMPEYQVLLDEQKRLKDVVRKEPDEAHQLIEEFMLLANEVAALRMAKKKGRALYRIHEAPDPERLNQYRENLKEHGLKVGDLTQSGEVQKLLNRLKDHSMGSILQVDLLRCFKQARYYPEQVGHYGLAKEHYTHFTSPIRRYSDLIVHRFLFSSVTSGHTDLHGLSDHLSAKERSSAEAEQSHRFLVIYEFLERQLRLPLKKQVVFKATVTEVRNFGLFVELLEFGLSGLVPISSLKDDFYDYQEDRGIVIGRKTKRKFAVGDRLQVRSLKVDRFKKQVDFCLDLNPDDRRGRDQSGRAQTLRNSRTKKAKSTRTSPLRNQRKSDRS